MNKKIIKLFLINTILISILSFGNVYAATGNGASISGGGSGISGGNCNYESQYCVLTNSTWHVNGVRLTLVNKDGKTVGNSIDAVVANTWRQPVNGNFYT